MRDSTSTSFFSSSSSPGKTGVMNLGFFRFYEYYETEASILIFLLSEDVTTLSMIETFTSSAKLVKSFEILLRNVSLSSEFDVFFNSDSSSIFF